MLGRALTTDRGIEQKLPEPDSEEVVVDPGGLKLFRTRLGGASGASGEIYAWLELDLSAPFPAAVRARCSSRRYPLAVSQAMASHSAQRPRASAAWRSWLTRPRP